MTQDFQWQFVGATPAAQQMQGYRPNVPAQPVSAPGVQSRGMATFDMQQNAQGASLMDEYRRNEARIAEIETEIRNLEANGQGLDELDMALARNRAGIGDTGTALAHLGRIDTRGQLARQEAYNERNFQLRKAEMKNAGKGEKTARRKEIDNAYIMMSEGSPSAQNAWKRAIASMEEDYLRDFGEAYTPIEIPTGATEDATSFSGWDELYNRSLEKGRLSQAQKDSLLESLMKLPKGQERNTREEKLKQTGTHEGKAAADAKERREEEDAIKESEKISGWDLKTGDSKTYSASNGKTVTITNVGGKVKRTCGKTTR